jgi:peptide/nickel transport system substrate-binding protein
MNSSAPRGRRRARSYAVGAGVVTSLIALAACGVSHSGASGSQGSVSASAVSAAFQTFNVAAPGSRTNLYVADQEGTVNHWIAGLVQEGLVWPTGNGSYKPALATSWSEPNPTTYVFNLRQNAKFSNGAPLTAADVVYSIQFAASPKYSPETCYYLEDLKSVAQTGPDQVTVKLSAPQNGFLGSLSTAGGLWVSSESYLKAHLSDIGTATGLILGTGPYKVTRFVPDEGVWLTRDGTWWGGTPKIKNIVVTFYNDENAEYLAAKSGAVDLALWIMPTEEPEWNGLSGFYVTNAQQASYVGLVFNPNVAPFTSIHVRQAIADAFDKQTFVQDVLKGGDSEVATGISAPTELLSAYSLSQASALLAALPQPPQSLAAAKQQLAESPVPHGFTTTLDWPNNGPQLGLAAQVLASDLAKIGIKLQVTEVPIAQWLGSFSNTKIGLNFMWNQLATGDMSEYVEALLGPGNPSYYTNPQITALLNQENSQTNLQLRAQEIVALNKLADSTYLLDVPLWYEPIGMAFKDGLGIPGYNYATFYGPWAASIVHTQG